MNTHKRNPSFKLTMVSIWYRGIQRTQFLMLPIHEDGRAKVDMDTINKIMPGMADHSTFTIG